MYMLALNDWELRLTFFSAETMGEIRLVAERIVERIRLGYNPRIDIRNCVVGGRGSSAARGAGLAQKVSAEEYPLWGDVGWWKEPRSKGWVGISAVVRRMETVLVGKKSD